MAINLRVIDNFTLVDIALTAEKVTFCVFTKLFEMWNKLGDLIVQNNPSLRYAAQTFLDVNIM